MINLIYVMAIAIFASASYASTTTERATIDETKHLIASQEVHIGGSLVLPENRNLSSLVIMISGSGPQDRDETLDGFKVFRTLAEHLAQQGIATFRFDDRGVGESTGDFPSSTLEDHANDVRTIMEYFKHNGTFPFEEFVLLGHSQGGIVSAHVAVGNQDVDKVILMGAPSVPLVDIVLYQLRQEYIGTSINRALIEAEVSSHNRLMYAINEGKNIKRALEAFRASTKAILSQSAATTKMDAARIELMTEAKTKEFEVVYALPSLTSFLYHDTSKDYEKLQVPVLSLFGGKDLQVTIGQNKDPMELALLKSETPYHFKTFSDANHYFQKAYTGQRDEYETLDKAFIDGFPECISDWLLAN